MIINNLSNVKECPELDQWRPRKAVWKDWRESLGGWAVSKKEEEEDLLANPTPVIHRQHVPARYAIKFVPASGLSPVIPVDASGVSVDSVDDAISTSATDFSVVSSANFVPAFTPCIGTN